MTHIKRICHLEGMVAKCYLVIYNKFDNRGKREEVESYVMDFVCKVWIWYIHQFVHIL